MRFLVIRLSSVGDIVHALPAVAALGGTYPEAEISWAVETRYAALVERNPFVGRVLAFDTLGWRRRLGSAAVLEQAARSLIALRELRFDAAIDFQGLVKSALIARVSRAEQRLGFSEYWLREPSAGVFYSERVGAGGRAHVVAQNLALVEKLGVRPVAQADWQFPLPERPEDDEYVERQLATLDAREFVIVNPGGGWISKRWAPENYAELIRRLEPELTARILLTGSPDEAPLIRGILERAGPGRACLFPSTLTQFIALARRARLFVGGDTGPMHLAAAAGTPIVAIYGPTDPERNGPFSARDIALTNSGPIDHTRRGRNPQYLAGIAVELVLEAIHQRLARTNGR